MNCYICGEPSVGQCQFCWQFHCREHSEMRRHGCSSSSWLQHFLYAVPQGTPSGDAHVVEGAGLLAAPEFHGAVLERVVPVVKTQIIGQTEVTIISVEIYDDGFVVNDRIRRFPSESAITDFLIYRDVRTRWEASDGSEQEFFGLLGAGCGGATLWRGATAFAPKPSRGAKTLILVAGEVVWQREDEQAEVQPGPWRFEIPLK